MITNEYLFIMPLRQSDKICSPYINSHSSSDLFVTGCWSCSTDSGDQKLINQIDLGRDKTLRQVPIPVTSV